MRSRKERFITDALEFNVVRAGDYRGDLMVMQHRYFIPRGSYDYTWMFSPAGVELGMIFTDDFNEAQWNAIRDGREYTAPADSSGQAKPPK